MKKIVYSLLLFLSVSCSSAATQSASIPEKKVETVSKEKIIQNQSKDFLTFAIHYIEHAKWLFVNTYFVILLINTTPFVKKKGIFNNINNRRWLSLIIYPLVVTCIAAGLSTYLHFINEEKEVKKQGKRLSSIKHFLFKWGLALLSNIFTIAPMIFFANAVDEILKKRITNRFIRDSYQLFIIPLSIVCLFVAPIATYLIDYMGLTSDEVIKPRKTAQKGDLSFFLTRWASYGSLMLIYHMIAGVLITVFLEKEVMDSLLGERSSTINQTYKKKALLGCSLTSLMIMLAIAILSAWISYTLEKKKSSSEHNTFSNHLLHNAVSVLLSFLSIFSMFLFIYQKPEWGDKLLALNVVKSDLPILFTLECSPLLCCVIIAPILVLIERYLFTKKSAQRDSSKKSVEEAQSKADIM